MHKGFPVTIARKPRSLTKTVARAHETIDGLASPIYAQPNYKNIR